MGGPGETDSIARSQFVIGIDDRPCFCQAQENVDKFDNPIFCQSVRTARGGGLLPAAAIPTAQRFDRSRPEGDLQERFCEREGTGRKRLSLNESVAPEQGHDWARLWL
jgi:hypothetical protein